MEQRLSILTLGVRDLPASVRFFERLGWRRSAVKSDAIAFFRCGGLALALYPHAALAKDVGVAPDGSGFEGFTLAHNARSKPEVDAILDAAKSAGAEIVKPAQDVFWGGYSGYFRDLDGHLWEVAWNPHFALDHAGALLLPE
jgi:uncharacterized protein